LQSSGAARRALGAAPAEYRDWEWLHFTSRLDEARLVLSGGALPTIGGKPVAFRPDGKLVATAATDRTGRGLDTATGREVGALAGQGQFVQEPAFSPDGRRLLVFTGDGTLQSWNPSTNERQVLLRIPFTGMLGDVLSPDQHFLVGVTDDAFQLW